VSGAIASAGSLEHVQQGEQDQRPDDGREDRPEATEAV
jgi:hypothetical protein